MAKKGVRKKKSPQKALKKASKKRSKKTSKRTAKKTPKKTPTKANAIPRKKPQKKQTKKEPKTPKELPTITSVFPPEGKKYQFETLSELVQLLQHINNECALKGKWQYRLFVFPCDLDDMRFYLGCQYGRVYITRNSEEKGLWRPVAREVLKKYYDRVPRLVLKDDFWAYDFCRSDPPGGHVIHVTDPAIFIEVAQVIERYIEDLIPKREARRKLKETSAPPWASCSICDPIPESVYGFWKGGDLESGGIPATEQYLFVVGEPNFNDSTSFRHWCLKQCPECSTCYLWQFDYEFLVGGSEDEIEMKRLTPEEEKEWKQKVFDVIRKSKDQFEAKAPAYIEILQTIKRTTEIRKAVDYFYHEQLVNGHDITEAIPALVHALAHHQHVKKETNCPGFWIVSLLRDYSQKTRKNRELLLETLNKNKDNITSQGNELEKLIPEIAFSDFDYDLY